MPSPRTPKTAVAVRAKAAVSTRAKIIALTVGCAALGLAAYGFGFIPDIGENKESSLSVEQCKSKCAQTLQDCAALPKADVSACEAAYEVCAGNCAAMVEEGTLPQGEQLSDEKAGRETEGVVRDEEKMEWRIVDEEKSPAALEQRTLFSMDGRPSDIDLTVSAIDGNEVRRCNEGYEFSFRAAFRVPLSETELRYAWVRSDGSSLTPRRFVASHPDQFYTDNYRERFSTSTQGVIGVRILAPVERMVTSTFFLDTNVCGSTNSSTEPPPTESDDAASTIDSSGLVHVNNVPRTMSVSPDKWRSHAMNIPFMDFHREILSGNRLLVTSDQGRFGVVVPAVNADSEPFARFSLMRLKISYENTEAILGRPFIMPGPIRSYFIIDPETYRMRIGGLEEVEGIFAPAWYFPDEQAFSRHSNLALPENSYILRYWDRPGADHELVHRFVMGTELSLVLNEGLANYIPNRVMYGVSSSLECRANGYTSGGSSLQPYFRDGEPLNLRRIYDTGECFWWILHNTYGADAVTRVMRERLHIIQRGQDLEPDGPTLAGGSLNRNIRRLFIPILGQSVWSTFAGFGASPDGM